MIRQHLGHATGQVGGLQADHGGDDLVRVRGAGLFHRLDPEIEADVVGLHGVVGHPLGVLGERMPLLDEGGVGGGVHAHEVVPGRQVAHQGLGVDARKLFLAHGEGHHRDVLGGDALVTQFLVEGHVGIAVDGGDHGGLLAGGAELLDIGDDGLPVGMTEGGVVDQDVFLRHPFALEVGLQDLVGGAGIDIVGPGQYPALHPLIHEVVHRRDGLLVGRGAGVEDVLGRFLTLVLHGVEEQAVQFLEDRQHRLAGHRGPAAEDGGHLVLGQQLPRLLGEQGPVGRRVHHHGLELLAQQPTLFVLLRDQHQHGVLQRGLADGHGAGQGMQDTHLDGIGGLRHCRQAQAGRQTGGQQGGFD